MKTEPTEAFRAMANDLKYNVGVIHSNPQLILEESFISGVRYGQSSQKIKQLEWVEVWEGYEDVKTPFGHYVVRPSIDNKTFLMIDLRKGIEPYLTLSEAKAAAQADFEKRIKECIDINTLNVWK